MGKETPSIPVVNVQSFPTGLEYAYEVIDQTGEIPGSMKPIRIYSISTDRTDENLSFERTLIGSYEDFDQGISQNESEAAKANRTRNIVLGGAVGAVIFTSVGLKDTFYDQGNKEPLTPFDGTAIFGGPFVAAALILSSWWAKESRTNARNKKAVLEETAQSGKKRFLSHFNPKL